jgi:hypothetical protein
MGVEYDQWVSYNPQPYRGRPSNSHKRGGGGGNKKKDCCAMVAAGRAARRGKFRLAGRYARRSVHLIAARAGVS